MSRALFINGVFDAVLQEIHAVQGELPEQIMFLQPYSGSPMRELEKDPPTMESPMRLYISASDDLSTVRWEAEIVSWADKRKLTDGQRRVLNRLIWTLQPNEEGLYDAARAGSGESVNLLFIRRLKPVRRPFTVAQLTKTSNDEPLKEGRQTSGGWSYVYDLDT